MKLLAKNPAEIKKNLLFAGISQTDLAGKIGVSYSYLNPVVNGNKSVGTKTAKKIADILGKEMTDLFEIKEG